MSFRIFFLILLLQKVIGNRRSKPGLYVPFCHDILNFQAFIECLREPCVNRTFLGISSAEEVNKTNAQIAGNKEIPITQLPTLIHPECLLSIF